MERTVYLLGCQSGFVGKKKHSVSVQYRQLGLLAESHK